MSVTKECFGKTNEKIKIERYGLSNDNGLTSYWLTYGATQQALYFSGKDMVLGYDTLQEYEQQHNSYQGATIGRFSNVIADGNFTLNGVTYSLHRNEAGKTHLHGGLSGFDKKIWRAEIISDSDEPSISFSRISQDGEEGYPGNLSVSVTVTVNRQNELRIQYRAKTDADTIINLTNHSYFNLNGATEGDILDTQMTIYSDRIVSVNDRLIPDGHTLPVQETPFDFRYGKAIGQDIESNHILMKYGHGYDHTYLLHSPANGEKLCHAATAVSPRSRIQMECYTDQPSVQFYTANSLNESTGKYGVPLYQHHGFCLETQHVPDSPHHADYPSTVLKSGDTFYSETIYRFSMI